VRAYVITLVGNAYSVNSAARCIDSAARHGIRVETFPAVGKDDAEEVMMTHGLHWSWGEGMCPYTGLWQHRYGGGLARVGCAMSHFLLWRKCVEEGPLLILEHDAVFMRPLPAFNFDHICQINDPRGATRNGDWWSAQMIKRGPGVHPKTWVTQPSERRPDGLAGNSAYLIKPHAAKVLIDLYRTVGVWPNDATMCEQLVPGLQELYPFVTKVEQTVSTTSA
jgi:GR25 family glycosyltransferase involved in LPS biosynthesis